MNIDYYHILIDCIVMKLTFSYLILIYLWRIAELQVPNIDPPIECNM